MSRRDEQVQKEALRQLCLVLIVRPSSSNGDEGSQSEGMWGIRNEEGV